MSKDRRHASIMFTDIVGYTSLMGSDEDRAFEVLSKNREIHQQLVDKYNGTIIKELGDGMLISFNLASDAVYCAIEIQKKCKEQEIPLTIGIHEGEMVFEGADVIGDAVNVASRLESDTSEGCITISGSVYRDIKNKKDIQTKFIKEKKFKNVDDPIKVYKVLCDDDTDKQATSTLNEVQRRSKKPYYFLLGIIVIALTVLIVWKFIPINEAVELDKSVAVLPFDYLSQEKDKQYLADGVMDAITSNLAKISELKVVAKTSVEKYKEHSIDVREIGKELDVSYIVEGSFQLVGSDARLIIQLINTKDGNHAWSNEYDREWSDIFKVQSEVSQKIADEIAVEITPETRMFIESSPTNDLTAYDYYLRGEEYYNRSFQEEDFRYAIQMYEKSIEIDPNFTLAWIGLAGSSRFLYWLYHDRSEDRIIQTNQYLDHAIKLNSELIEVELENARYLYHCERKYNDALKILNKLKEKYPKNAEIYFWMAAIYKRTGEFEKSIDFYNYSIDLDPANWRSWSESAIVNTFIGNYSKAKECYYRVIDLNPSISLPYWGLIRLCYPTGELDKLNELLHNYDTPIDSIDLQIEEHLLEGKYEDIIKKLGEYSGYFDNYELGQYYYLASNKEKASEYFNKEKSFLEKKIETSENNDRLYGRLGIVYAGLGDKTKAINAGEKAIELLNINNDAMSGIYSELNMVRILLMVEEYDQAVSKLEYLIEYKGGVSVGYLKNHYLWRGFMKNEKYRALVNDPKYQIENLPKIN